MKTLPIIAVLAASAAFGQSQETVKFYKLDFVVKEVEGGKALNSRNYSMIASTDKTAGPGSIRAGSRVPVPTTPDGKQFNHYEIGTNIDIRAVQEVGGDLSMVLTAELSTMIQDAATPPVVRQNKWSSNIVVAARKPSIVFSSDDATTKRQMQLELTATPIK